MIKAIVHFKNCKFTKYINFEVLPLVGDLIKIDDDNMILAGIPTDHEIVGILHSNSEITNSVEINLLTVPTQKLKNYYAS